MLSRLITFQYGTNKMPILLSQPPQKARMNFDDIKNVLTQNAQDNQCKQKCDLTIYCILNFDILASDTEKSEYEGSEAARSNPSLSVLDTALVKIFLLSTYANFNRSGKVYGGGHIVQPATDLIDEIFRAKVGVARGHETQPGDTGFRTG
jgi:hypothetical protein